MKISGRAWKFGDNINTDLIYPRPFQRPKYEPGERAKGLLAGADPSFPTKVEAGDIIVGGRNFGCGSGREEAAYAMRETGVAAVVASGFGRMFMRNCINLGVPIVMQPGISGHIEEGDVVEVDLQGGVLRVPARQVEQRIPPMPPELLSMIEAGGLPEYTLRELARRKGAAAR